MQFQSDIINRTVIRPDNVETTSLGAAYLAGLATGFYESKEAIRRNVRISKIFTPDMTEEKRKRLIDGWHKAVRCALDWT
ncbi:MAG: glycerol kinase, partial [Lachnospiraceae bacterium]|nr:glycerol kinase [Lachnospiraceae bacterium]